jgi:hypothetical protein
MTIVAYGFGLEGPSGIAGNVILPPDGVAIAPALGVAINDAARIVNLPPVVAVVVDGTSPIAVVSDDVGVTVGVPAITVEICQ